LFNSSRRCRQLRSGGQLRRFEARRGGSVFGTRRRDLALIPIQERHHHHCTA
jgi:hypothetical protein